MKKEEDDQQPSGRHPSGRHNTVDDTTQWTTQHSRRHNPVDDTTQ